MIDQPAAGIVALLNMTIDDLDVGSVRFSLTSGETMTNPLGTVHGGIAATLLDSVASCAVHSALEPGNFSKLVEFTERFKGLPY